MSHDVRRLFVAVDPDACCGVGRCAMTEPSVFAQDDIDGTVVLLDPEPAPRLHDAVLLCADLCPCEAITARLI